MRSFRQSILGRILGNVAEAVCRYPRWFIWPQLALGALCAFYTTQRLQFDMNRDHLIGPKLRSQRLYLQLQREFPVPDELVVMVQSGNPERSRQFIERLAARVRSRNDLFVDLFYKADLTSLGHKGLLLAPAADLEHMRDSLRQFMPFIHRFSQVTNLDGLFEMVNGQFRAAAAGPNAGTESMLRALPFLEGILGQARESLLLSGPPPGPEIEALFAGGPQALSQLYITFEQGKVFLLTVRPASEALAPDAIQRLRALLSQTQFEVPGVDVGLTGESVLDYDEMRQAEHDSTVASLTALVLCSLLFIASYRHVTRPLKAALCLIVGLGYTMGYTTAVVGHLNVLSITFAPMLIGLAIDYGVHFITRYEEEMRSLRTAKGAVKKATVYTGQGIVTGGVTTASAFLAMALTHFKGIGEMGLVSGGGLLLCLIPMLTTLPALLLQGRQNVRDHQLGPAGHRRMRLENLWLRRPWLVLGFTLLLCALGALQARKVSFDYNLLHMQSQSLPSVAYEKRLLRAGGHSALFASVVADSESQARQFEQRLKQLPAVAGVDSAADLLGGDQARKLELVRQTKAELAGVHFGPVDRRPVHVDDLSATLWYLSGYLGVAADRARRQDPALAGQLSGFRREVKDFRKELLAVAPDGLGRVAEFQQALLANVHRTFAILRRQDTTGPMRPQDLPRALRDRFIGVTGKFLLQVYPRRDLWNHSNQQVFIRQAESAVPPERVTGTPLQLYEYTTLLKVSYQHAALYALGAIALMLLVQFRSVIAVLLSLLPVAVGAVWLLGFMGLAGVPFNPANIMTLPLLVGIGVTNGIQVLNRFAEEQNPRILAKSTGKAVLVSGLTALTGFGTLMLAKHQGIRSLGEVMAVGIAACMVAGLTCLPALLCLLMDGGWTLRWRDTAGPHA